MAAAAAVVGAVGRARLNVRVAANGARGLPPAPAAAASRSRAASCPPSATGSLGSHSQVLQASASAQLLRPEVGGARRRAVPPRWWRLSPCELLPRTLRLRWRARRPTWWPAARRERPMRSWAWSGSALSGRASSTRKPARPERGDVDHHLQGWWGAVASWRVIWRCRGPPRRRGGYQGRARGPKEKLETKHRW